MISGSAEMVILIGSLYLYIALSAAAEMTPGVKTDGTSH